MNIVILGGTGLVGKALAASLSQQGHQVTTHGRQVFQEDARISNALQGQEIVIQLSGANIAQRWTAAYKQEIWDSRVNTTQRLVKALNQLETPPKHFLCASAIGYYAQTDCTQSWDETGPHGEGFLAELSLAWEAEAQACQVCPTLITRFGVVLSRQGGALKEMWRPFQLGLGGPIGDGQQCFSWIHLSDLERVFAWILEQPTPLTGVVNVTAPQTLSQKAFGRRLSHHLHRPFGLPTPVWLLGLIFGEGAQVLTHSASVVPKRLLESGFEFRYPTADCALEALVNSRAPTF